MLWGNGVATGILRHDQALPLAQHDLEGALRHDLALALAPQTMKAYPVLVAVYARCDAR